MTIFLQILIIVGFFAGTVSLLLLYDVNKDLRSQLENEIRLRSISETKLRKLEKDIDNNTLRIVALVDLLQKTDLRLSREYLEGLNKVWRHE